MHKTDTTDCKQVGSYIFNPETDILGKGAFATVYKGADLANSGKFVAIKAIPNSVLFDSEDQYIRIMREIQILQQITGPHIVHLLDSKRTANNLYLVTEFCNGGDLESYLHKKRHLTEDESLYILKQLTHAFISLQSIEGVAIMHRDIKPANILFNDGLVKIADFGFAKMVNDNSKDIKDKHTLLGTPYYMNPQTLANEEYSTKCDIWSTGFVFYECLFGRTPWTGATIPALLENIKRLPLTFPSDRPVSSETRDLIINMLKFNEENRLDWQGVWNHPALQKVKIPAEAERKKSIIKIIKQEPGNIPKGPFQSSPRITGTKGINITVGPTATFQDYVGDQKGKHPTVLYIPQQKPIITEGAKKEPIITIPYANLQQTLSLLC